MTERFRLLAALTVFVVGTIFVCVVWFGGGSGKPRPHGGLTVAADIQVTRDAVLTAPGSSEEVAEAVSSFAAKVRVECLQLPPDLAMPPQQIDEFVALCTERLQLVLEPDYLRYLEHVRSLTGREIGPDGSGAFFNVRETWEKYASKFRWLPIDVSIVQVRARWKGGHEIAGFNGGHTYGVPDSKKYYSPVKNDPMAPRDAQADVYDVRVPVEVTDTDTGSKLRTFLVMTFIRSPAEPRWMPRFMGINDPTERESRLPPPWL